MTGCHSRRAGARAQAATLIHDGEIAVFDRQLLSRFEWLRGRPTDETATLPVTVCHLGHGPDAVNPPAKPPRNAWSPMDSSPPGLRPPAVP